MYKKIEFSYDNKGNYLGERLPGGHWDDKPRVLLASQCNSKSFNIYTGTARGHRGEVPAVTVSRNYKALSTDPYNEDGRPPTTLFRMLIPHIELIHDLVIIEGLEDPNLCWAGMLRPPYDDDFRHRRGIPFVSAEEFVNDWHSQAFETLHRQRIMLSPRDAA